MSYSVHNFQAGDVLYASELNEMDAQIALNEQNIASGISSDMIASEYSANKTYSIGDYVIHDGDLYKCIYNITAAEGWNSAHWQTANLGDGLSQTNSAFNDLAEIKHPENHIVLSADNLFGIPNDMTATISDGTITFSYPYESGNKSGFGIIFSNIENGKNYTLSFDVISGGLASADNIRVVTLTEQNVVVDLLGSLSKDSSHYSCAFTASLTAQTPKDGLRLEMQRAISTTVTLGNFSLIETGATDQLLVNNDCIKDLDESNFTDRIANLVEIKYPENHVVLSNSYLWGIPDDMTATINDGSVTFSYPYASGNKSGFGFIFSNIENGKEYTNVTI